MVNVILSAIAIVVVTGVLCFATALLKGSSEDWDKDDND